VTKYPYELLLKPADELPEDVNPELREVSKSLPLSLLSHFMFLLSFDKRYHFPFLHRLQIIIYVPSKNKSKVFHYLAKPCL